MCIYTQIILFKVKINVLLLKYFLYYNQLYIIMQWLENINILSIIDTFIYEKNVSICEKKQINYKSDTRLLNSKCITK